MKGVCSVCEKVKQVHRSRKTDKLICASCRTSAYRQDPSTHRKCFKCGEIKPIARRSKSGKPICFRCYQRSKVGKCAKCKKRKVIQALGLCYRCYQQQHRAKKMVAKKIA